MLSWSAPAALAVAGVLAFAAVSKLRDLARFSDAVAGYRILARGLVPVAARTVVGAELLGAVLLAVPPTRVWGSALAMVLFSAFLIGMGSVLRRGMRVSCGCLQTSERVGAGSLTRTGLLLALALFAGFGAGLSFEPVQLLGAALLAGVVFGVAALVSRLDAQPAAPVVGRQFEIGTDVSDFAGGGDRVLFAYISPLCGACRAMLPEFRAVVGRVPVVLVSSGEFGEVRGYLDGQGSDLPLVTGPEVFEANGVPGPPYAVLTDSSGSILAHRGVDRPEKLAALLGDVGL
ncbi:Methylamine utilisation protein MauE [Saccharopolyspora antimicrobica]|uniref:Methylamine utilisation protein MauE n=1 Tax=Saccharopolyspora antimicrobica TaxID=455193 RepID=A0A1I5GI25_9PSEU|nr:MauE/DoxX family redox-associated membrane protein [Saccharopolyspora antimicrobica]RKT87533.1 methylamine utilization protein MauE [Saccharopolyspora antimicrobica]SFO35597.1 Methylamine utilisation protein MauE [Saccharopolyspora antimicrobica]